MKAWAVDTHDRYLEKRCDSAEEFVSTLLGSDFSAHSGYDSCARGRAGWIFRGHSNINWKLLPSAHRPGSPLTTYSPQAPSGDNPLDTRDARIHRLGWQLYAELRAVRLFIEQADALGIATPISYSILDRHLDAINAALNIHEFDYAAPFPDVELHAEIALAQHYGVPTRLLDWTEHPLVAAYFASYECSKKLKGVEPCSDQTLSVVALNTFTISKLAPIRLTFAPKHNNPFLQAQRGLFTYIESANDWYLKHGEWPDIESVQLISEQPRGWLRRISVPAQCADEILKLLWRHDITRHHLMPSLENAAKACDYRVRLFK